MEWGTLWSRGWEVGNERWRVDLGYPQKPSCRGSVLAKETQGVAWVCQGECPGVG